MAMETAEIHSSAHIAPQRQYDWWREAVSATHLSWDLPRRTESAYAATFRQQALGPAQLVQCACDPCAGRRGKPEIAQQKEPAFGILYIVKGQEHLRQAGRETTLQPGHFTLWDSTQPIEFALPDLLHKVTLLLPQDLLEGVLPRARDQIMRPISGQRGRGAIFATHLRALAREARDVPEGRVAPVLRATLDLLATALDPADDEAGSRYSQALLARIQDYILRHLEDPELNPDAVAAAMGISPRQLHRLFNAGELTVDRWIWRQRLLRCRHDLLLRPRERVSQIAFDWGFSDAAHFSRAFRELFGDSPRAYRRRLLGADRGIPSDAEA